MTQNSVNISAADLLRIAEWISTFDTAPRLVRIITETTPIGTAVRAEVETQEGEGRWKDVTDYNTW